MFSDREWGPGGLTNAIILVLVETPELSTQEGFCAREPKLSLRHWLAGGRSGRDISGRANGMPKALGEQSERKNGYRFSKPTASDLIKFCQPEMSGNIISFL